LRDETRIGPIETDRKPPKASQTLQSPPGHQQQHERHTPQDDEPVSVHDEHNPSGGVRWIVPRRSTWTSFKVSIQEKMGDEEGL
jgi:hypothetical protein